MELIIDIPEEVKSRLCFGITYPKDIQVICEALNNGTPLPKGHGRLIDADALEVGPRFNENGELCGHTYITEYELCNAPTIIESDKESK